MTFSNTEILTHAHAVLRAKARTKRHQIDHIAFDEEARHEYLTGFRKRNLQKKEAAMTRAKEREHQERLQARREARQALREQALENAKRVEDACRGGNNSIEDDDEEEFTGFSPLEKGKARAAQEAYEDAEQLATVTIVEEFDPADLRHAQSTSRTSPDASGSDMDDTIQDRSASRDSGSKSIRHQHNRLLKHASNFKPAGQSSVPDGQLKRKITKIKPKKVAYETKAARKTARLKQKTRQAEKASLAGGKQSKSRRPDGKRRSRK